MTLDLMTDVVLLAILIEELADPGTYSDQAIENALDELKERISERAYAKRDETESLQYDHVADVDQEMDIWDVLDESE